MPSAQWASEVLRKAVELSEDASIQTRSEDDGQEPGRRETSTLWPNLFIVGAARSGTTSLHFYLGQHPETYMSPMKETHFFSRIAPDPRLELFYPHIDDEATYLALFEAGSGAKVRGEASPSYLWDPDTAARLKEVSPEAKIIIVLREPVSRAYSHYLVDSGEGLDDRPFLQAVQEELKNPPKGWGQSSLYVQAGLYAESVERYLWLFGPNVKVLIFEEFVADLRAHLAEIFRFLGVEPEFAVAVDLEPHNVFHAPRNVLARRILGSLRLRRRARALVPAALHPAFRSVLVKRARKPEIEREAEEVLTAFYRPDIERLAQLLGRSLPW